jgi:diguanylate cyclase (GGDEF)-like protein/PAS domain S-box-containing protein
VYQSEVGATGAAILPRRWFRDAVLIGLGATAALVLGTLWLEIPDAVGQIQLFCLVQPLLDVVMVLILRGTLRTANLPASQRRFFWALAIMVGLFSVGDSIQAINVMRAGDAASSQPGVAQLTGLVLGSCVVLLTLMFYPTAMTTTLRQRYRFALDATTVLIGGAGLVWAGSVRNASDVAAALLLAGLVMTITFAGLKLLRSGAAPLTGAAMLLCMLATAIQGVAIVISGQSEQPSGALLAFQLLPSLVLPAGLRVQQLTLIRRAATGPSHRDVARSESKHGNRGFTLLPYLSMAAADCALVAVLADRANLRIWGVVVTIIVISGLVALRQIDHLTESSQRTDDLEGWERWVNALLRHSADVTFVADPTGQITYASPSLQAVLGIPPEDLVGRPADALIYREDMARYLAVLDEIAEPGATATVTARVQHADGEWRWMEITTTNLLTDPLVHGIVGNARDVTDALGLQNRLRHQATHDSLTGLPNRALFSERLDEAIGEPLALLLIDLDGFKAINDTYGHPAGDTLLVAVASRLRRCVRPEDTPARLGGDEFAVVLPGADREEAEHVARRLAALLTETVAVDGVLLTVQASIGIATGPTDDPELLMRNADEAMYASKRSQARGESVATAL